MIKSNIGENIRRIRIEKELTQRKLGEMIGVSDKTISSWESNRTEPSIFDVENMATAMKCKKSDILSTQKNAGAKIAANIIAGTMNDETIGIISIIEKLNPANQEIVKNLALSLLANQKQK